MSEEKKLEQVIILSLETAQKMIKEHKTITPFAAWAFTDNNDIKMSSYQESLPDGSWQELIEHTVKNMRRLEKDEKLQITAVITALESGNNTAIGIQIETVAGAKLFIYPYSVNDSENISIDEPIQSDMLIAGKVFQH